MNNKSGVDRFLGFIFDKVFNLESINDDNKIKNIPEEHKYDTIQSNTENENKIQNNLILERKNRGRKSNSMHMQNKGDSKEFENYLNSVLVKNLKLNKEKNYLEKQENDFDHLVKTPNEKPSIFNQKKQVVTIGEKIQYGNIGLNQKLK